MGLDALRQVVRNNLQSADVPTVEIYQDETRHNVGLRAAWDETFRIAQMGVEGDTYASHPKYAIARAAAEPKRYVAPEARWKIDPRTSRIIESPDAIANGHLIQYSTLHGGTYWSNWTHFTHTPNGNQLWGVESIQLTGRGVSDLTAEHLTMLAMDLYHDRSNGRCVEYFVSVEQPR